MRAANKKEPRNEEECRSTKRGILGRDKDHNRDENKFVNLTMIHSVTSQMRERDGNSKIGVEQDGFV